MSSGTVTRLAAKVCSIPAARRSAAATNGPRTAPHRITVRVTVTNTGHDAGTATPQVYLMLPSSIGEPGQRLVAFDRVDLRPGDSSASASLSGGFTIAG
jgi:hypothetical protein